MPFLPIGHDEREPVEDKLAETGVILRQIIDVRLVALFGWTNLLTLAVEVAWAAHLETKLCMGITRIQFLKPLVVLGPVFTTNQAQGVSREIARLIDHHSQASVNVTAGHAVIAVVVHLYDLDTSHAPAALDHHVIFRESLRNLAEEMDAQLALIAIINHLDVINPAPTLAAVALATPFQPAS